MDQMPNQLLEEAEGSAPSLGAPQGPDPSASPHHPALSGLHSQAKAQFDAVDKVDALAQLVRKGLDSLVAKGPAVTSDDVLEEMAILVSKGADPKALSALMAGGSGTPPMPDSGPALQQWISQQDQMVRGREAVLEGPKRATAHEMGVSALHLLLHNHQQRQGGAPPEAPPAPPNPLMGAPTDAA